MSHIKQRKNCIQTGIVLMFLLGIFMYAYHCEKVQQNVYQALAEKKHSDMVTDLKVNRITSPIGVDDSYLLFSWETKVKQEAYQIIVKTEGNDAEERIIWDSQKVVSKEPFQRMGQELLLEDCQSYEYVVCVYDKEGKIYISSPAEFTTAFLHGDVFEDAFMLSMDPEENIYESGQAVFYSSFESGKSLKRATLYASALGVYDAYINGQRIGEDELKPGWTDYSDTLLYNTYDITDMISKENTIAAMVGTGWWCGRNGFGTYGYHQPGFICKIILEYKDGTTETVSTTKEWKYCKNTAVRFADFFNGETYDARCLTTKQISEGEKIPKEDARPVHISTEFRGEYKSHYAYNVKVIPDRSRKVTNALIYNGIKQDGSDFGTILVTEEDVKFPVTVNPGETLLIDFGQNMTGVPQIEYQADSGSKIELLFAEMLNDSGKESRGNDGPKGSLYRANYRSATTTVTVIAGEEEVESYRPTFFYAGFRYLSLTSDTEITVQNIEGLFVANSAKETATFETDYEPVNQLWQNAYASQRNNFMLVATDCPQRDERIGWMGDLRAFADTSMYMQDLYGFYRKWMQDVTDAQTAEGAYTDTVPATITTGSGNGGWAEAGILVPLAVYQKYGDRELLQKQYPSMQRYMGYLKNISNPQPNEKRFGPLTTYGDWLSTELSDPQLISALWYAADAKAMEEIALVLGKTGDVVAYRKLQREIKDYILEAYEYKMPWEKDGSKKDKAKIEYPLSQTEILLMLTYTELSKDKEQLLVADLKKSLKDNNYKVMTGFAGTPLLLPVLSRHGLQEEAYKVLLCEENPSWLYSVNAGATTIWERYDSYTLESGFADASMNSFNHFNEGSVAQWMMEDLLGIRVDLMQKEPIIIAPLVPENLTKIHRASGGYDSIFGRIEFSWEMKEDGTFFASLSLPQNAKAMVRLPIEGQDEMVVSGGKYEWTGKYKLLE